VHDGLGVGSLYLVSEGVYNLLTGIKDRSSFPEDRYHVGVLFRYLLANERQEPRRGIMTLHVDMVLYMSVNEDTH
jgi:hypothetical protein